MATAVVVEPSPSMSVAWMVSVYSGTFWGERSKEEAHRESNVRGFPAEQQDTALGVEAGGQSSPPFHGFSIPWPTPHHLQGTDK